MSDNIKDAPRINIRVPEDLLTRIDLEAERRILSRNALVLMGLELLIARFDELENSIG